MPSVLIVNEIATEREELSRAMQAEGFKVVTAESAADAVREIWEGTFICVLIASILEGTNPQQLAEQLQNMAPEVETIIHSKSDDKSRTVRKVLDIRDGVAAA